MKTLAAPKRRAGIDHKIFAADVQVIMTLLRERRADAVLTSKENAGRYADEADVARSLHYLRELVFSHQKFRDEAERRTNEDAQALLEALAFDRDHPIWNHILGLLEVRRGRRAIPTTTALRRAAVVVYARILRAPNGRPGYTLAVKRLSASGLHLTTDTLRRWANDADINFKAMIDAIQKHIEERADQGGPFTVDEIALIWVMDFWGMRGADARLNTPGYSS